MSADNHTLTLPWVETATCGFIHATQMREATSLALALGENTIFSGPGGHGKSEFFGAVCKAVGDIDPYVMSFGQGTSPDQLYGGIDFNALNPQGGGDKAVLQFSPELSFLAYEVAIFEELFDAPPRVLTSLKDTLTARELRNGHQRHKMKTKIIFAATNHSPTEIAEGGPEIAALIERFPIQLEVVWPDYSESSFLELLQVVSSQQSTSPQVTWSDVAALQERTRQAAMSKTMHRMLSKIIVDLRRDKVVISPRTAVKAMQIAKAAAVINGRDKVIPQDLIAISFLPGASALRERISELIAEYEAAVIAEEKLDQLELEFMQLRETLSDDELASVCCEEELDEFEASLNRLGDEIDSVQVTSDVVDRKNILYGKVLAAIQKVSNVRQQRLEEIESGKLEKLKQDFAPLREVLLDTDLFSVCSEEELEEFARSLGGIIKGIDSMVLVTNLTLRKSDLRKEVVRAMERAEVALDDLRLAEDAKAQRPMLEKFGRDIKAQLNSVRYARTSQDKNEAMNMLRGTWDDLRSLALHSDLEETRQGLYDKIELGLTTQGIVLSGKAWTLPA